MRRPITFDTEKSHGALARAGVVHTPHGDIRTPAFITVATKASVKGIAVEDFAQLGIQALIGNAYHLYLTPGEKLIAEAGGLGAFMGFTGPTMTDSGGFQILSLAGGMGKKVLDSKSAKTDEEGVVVFDEEVATSHGKFAVVDDEGVSFTSHYDGSLHRFTPERSMEIQHALGADIMFAFDECTSSDRDKEYQKVALERTSRWAKRCLDTHLRIEYENSRVDMPAEAPKGRKRGLYGIVQ